MDFTNFQKSCATSQIINLYGLFSFAHFFIEMQIVMTKYITYLFLLSLLK